MLFGCKISTYVVVLALVFSMLTLEHCTAQYQPSNGQSAQNRQQSSGQQQYPQLTPEQQAAQQRAAEQAAYEEQLRRQQAMSKPPQQPEGFPLDQNHQQYLEKLLDYWEQSSSRVKKYKCNFRRFTYDNAIVAWRDQSNQLAAHRIAFGEIRFASPDRARYETSTIMNFAKPPQAPGQQADYKKVDDVNAIERWICDGKSIYEFDFVNKKLYETPIPPAMQGNVVESPLPFLFGAKKKLILDRYWVRTSTPKGVENEYWLVAYPKRIKDARLYSKVEIILAKEDFLPKAMHMYTPQYDPKTGNEESYYFTFENREVNGQLTQIQDFFGSFIKPRLPLTGGWKKVVNQPTQNQAAVPKIDVPAERGSTNRR